MASRRYLKETATAQRGTKPRILLQSKQAGVTCSSDYDCRDRPISRLMRETGVAVPRPPI